MHLYSGKQTPTVHLNSWRQTPTVQLGHRRDTKSNKDSIDSGSAHTTTSAWEKRTSSQLVSADKEEESFKNGKSRKMQT